MVGVCDNAVNARAGPHNLNVLENMDALPHPQTHKQVLKGAGKLNQDHRERTEFAAATPSTRCMQLGCLLAPPSCSLTVRPRY